MPALVGVGARAAPVLLQEHPQPGLGAGQILLRIQRAQDLVVGDLFVEPRDDPAERIGATDGVVEGLLGLIHRSHCRRSPSARNPGQHPVGDRTRLITEFLGQDAEVDHDIALRRQDSVLR